MQYSPNTQKDGGTMPHYTTIALSRARPKKYSNISVYYGHTAQPDQASGASHKQWHSEVYRLTSAICNRREHQCGTPIAPGQLRQFARCITRWMQRLCIAEAQSHESADPTGCWWLCMHKGTSKRAACYSGRPCISFKMFPLSVCLFAVQQQKTENTAWNHKCCM